MTSDHGKRAEKRTLERVPASGAWIGAKGDFRGEAFLIEHKSTVKKSFGLKLELLRKIAREALRVGLRPAFHVTFVNEMGRPVHDGGWVMVREKDWEEMTRVTDSEQSASEG